MMQSKSTVWAVDVWPTQKNWRGAPMLSMAI